MSSESLAHALFHDFPTFARLCLKIEGKDGGLVPFELNKAQMIVWDETKRQIDAGLPVRIMILKGRQQGMSTLIQGMSMWLACTREGFKSMTIAHKLKPPAMELFGKVELMHRNLPPEIKAQVPQAAGRQVGRRLKFDEPMRSTLVVESAEETEAVGRSGTFMFGHLTEVPFWPRIEETIAAFMACVPSKPGTFVFVESTANGMGDWFHKTWRSGKQDLEHNRKPAFTPVFVPWYVEKDYARPRTDLDHALTRIEKQRMKKFGLTEDQIMWYRDRLGENGETEAEHGKTCQEYPDQDDDAFLSSGRPFFWPQAVEEHSKHAKMHPPVRKGEFHLQREQGRKWKFVPSPQGELWIWDTPREGHSYVVPVDSSSGRSNDNGAFHVLDVTNIHKVRQVASFVGMRSPKDLAALSIVTARYYNNALWAPESNAIGQAVIAANEDIGYPNVYRMTRTDTIDGHAPSKLLGWHTNPKSRPRMLEGLAEHVHEHMLEINCTRTLEEMPSFIFLDDGGHRAGAAKGAHDDLLMSLAIGVAVKKAAIGEVGFEVWSD